MDRRLLLKGVFGLAGAAAVAAVLPQTEAHAGIPSLGQKPDSSVLPNLEELKANPEAGLDEGVELASHRWDHYRRRRWRRHRYRRRRWRQVCRSYWHRGRWRRRCRRRPVWIWIGI
ncbi:MAG: protamine-2 (modular protein) [Pseudomonadota bacterium]